MHQCVIVSRNLTQASLNLPARRPVDLMMVNYSLLQYPMYELLSVIRLFYWYFSLSQDIV